MLGADELFNQTIERFWQVEELDRDSRTLTLMEKACENHFNRITKKEPDGRFVTSLPFSTDANILGDSGVGTLRKFYSLEGRFYTKGIRRLRGRIPEVGTHERHRNEFVYIAKLFPATSLCH